MRGGKITSITVQILKRNEIRSLFRPWSSERENRCEHAVSRYYIFIGRVSVIFPPSSAESSLPEMYYTQEIRRNRKLSESGSSFVCRGRANLIKWGCCSRVCASVGCDVVFSVGAKNVFAPTPLLAFRGTQIKFGLSDESAHFHCQSSHTLLRSIYPSQGPNHWLEIKSPRQFFPIADTTYHTTLQTNSRPHRTTQNLKQNSLLPFPRGFRTQ